MNAIYTYFSNKFKNVFRDIFNLDHVFKLILNYGTTEIWYDNDTDDDDWSTDWINGSIDYPMLMNSKITINHSDQTIISESMDQVNNN